MNIDELKNAWNEDIFENTPEISTEQSHKINLPLEKIRKNMRMEFWSTVAIFVFSFSIIAVCNAPFKFKFYFDVLIASMLIVTAFFFSKFFKLYREMSSPVMKTADTLRDLLLQLNLNKQYYLSFCLAFVPFLVCELIIVIECIPRPELLSDLRIAVILISTLVAGLFALYFFGQWWFKRLYGKHIIKIEKLVQELEH